MENGIVLFIIIFSDFLGKFLFFVFIILGFVGLEVLVLERGVFLLGVIINILLNWKFRFFFGYFGFLMFLN